MWNPPDSYYQPPEPPEPCCHLYEDDPDHDVEQCLADQREDAAERKAEADRDARDFDDPGDNYFDHYERH